MGSEIVKTEEKGMVASARSADNILAQKKVVADVMAKVMKNGTHYGTIPGCGDKPALLKPGIETLTSTFRLALMHKTEDLSTDDSVRYRVTSTVVYSPTGQVLGDALGECSSEERKYKWRAPVCKEEFDETAPDRRREFWKKGWKNSPPTKIQQVRTDHADIANTVLKMATKRADAGAVLLALGVSDIFAQDIEEWTPEMIAAMADEDLKAVQEPQRKSETKPKPKPKPAAKKSAPPPPEPAPAPEPAPKAGDVEEVDGELVDEDEVDAPLVGYVTAAKIVKKGQSAKGPWTMHIVTINEEDFVTFSDSHFTTANELMESESRCVFEYEETDRGYKLTHIAADAGDVPF